MPTVRVVLIAVLNWSCAMSVGAAQASSRVEAAVADLAADGRPDNGALFLFSGCPQDDADGLAVFEAVRDMPLDPWGLEDLAGNLAFQVYPNCGYVPLDEWYTDAFERLHADRALGPMTAFVIRLGLNDAQLIKSDMQEALLRAAEDVGGGRLGEELVRTALFYRPRELWIDEAISAFRRPLPRESIGFATYRLSREFGPDFYERLVADSPSFSDETLFTVISALGSEVGDGRADPNAPGLEELRTLSERRLQPYPPRIPRERNQPIR